MTAGRINQVTMIGFQICHPWRPNPPPLLPPPLTHLPTGMSGSLAAANRFEEKALWFEDHPGSTFRSKDRNKQARTGQLLWSQFFSFNLKIFCAAVVKTTKGHPNLRKFPQTRTLKLVVMRERSQTVGFFCNPINGVLLQDYRPCTSAFFRILLSDILLD